MRRLSLLILPVTILIFSLSMQSFPQQDKAAAKLAKMEKQLVAILGTDTNWKASIFKDLRLGMPCSQVKKYFKGLKCAPAKKYDFPKVTGKLFGKVKEYKFTFKYGKLQSATIVFGARAFDSKRFETALLNVCQEKWGKLPPEKMAKKVKVWINSDYDSVSLSYVSNNWQLKISMPKKDTGDVTAGSLGEAEIRTALAKLLGPAGKWKAAALTKFNRGNTCDQVKKIYSVMKGCDPGKSWSFGSVLIKNHPLVHALKFSFKNGQLHGAAFIFHRQLPREVFKKVSLEIFEKKWGPVKPGKRNNDILTIYKTNFGTAQRSFILDHWEIKHDFPK